MKAISFRGPLINVSRLRAQLRTAGNAAAKGAKVDFDVTTQTWKESPEFIIEPRGNDTAVYTTNKIYFFVDEGTDPHDIAPKNGKYLVFDGGGYKAKTRPRVIGSRQGGAGGGKVFTRKVVHHPGTEAREFSATIQEKWQARYPVIIQQAINKAVK